MSNAIVAAIAALLAAGLGGLASLRVAGPAWERRKLSAVAPLIEARLARYTALWQLTSYGPENDPWQGTKEQRFALAENLRAWYYDDGAGLLLSDDARRQWETVVAALNEESRRPSDVWRAMSCLRTRLKQDLHVHDPTLDDTSCRDQPNWIRASQR